MHKLLLMSVLGLGLGIGASQAAEVVVRVGPPHYIREHRMCAQVRGTVCGLRATTDGMDTHTSGCRAAGSFRPVNMPCGLPRAGSIGTMATCLSRVAGVVRLNPNLTETGSAFEATARF